MSDQKKFKLSDAATRMVLEKAVRHAFEGNFKCPITAIEDIKQDDLAASASESLMSPYVHISGDFVGTICLQMPKALVREIALNSLGFEAFKEEMFAGDQILTDASGEVVNMIAGTFKNMLSRVKMACSLMPPQVFDDESTLVRYLFSAPARWFLNLNHGEHRSQVILFTRRVR